MIAAGYSSACRVAAPNCSISHGSLSNISPATQPSKAAPAQTRTGKRVRRLVIIEAPSTISGIEITRPATSSGIESLATAAMASTLSRLMTISAMATVCTAFQSLLLAAIESSSLSPSSMTSLTAIQTNSPAPMICRKGAFSSEAISTVKSTRRNTATLAPSAMPLVRCSGAKARQASAITTALSPDRTIFSAMISKSLPQIWGSAAVAISIARGLS